MSGTVISVQLKALALPVTVRVVKVERVMAPVFSVKQVAQQVPLAPVDAPVTASVMMGSTATGQKDVMVGRAGMDPSHVASLPHHVKKPLTNVSTQPILVHPTHAPRQPPAVNLLDNVMSTILISQSAHIPRLRTERLAQAASATMGCVTAAQQRRRATMGCSVMALRLVQMPSAQLGRLHALKLVPCATHWHKSV